jgi:hypothetical protein
MGLVQFGGVKKILKISRQWAAKVVKRENFPPPVGLIDGRKTWCEHCIYRYKREHPTKRGPLPGTPRTTKKSAPTNPPEEAVGADALAEAEPEPEPATV